MTNQFLHWKYKNTCHQNMKASTLRSTSEYSPEICIVRDFQSNKCMLTASLWFIAHVINTWNRSNITKNVCVQNYSSRSAILTHPTRTAHQLLVATKTNNGTSFLYSTLESKTKNNITPKSTRTLSQSETWSISHHNNCWTPSSIHKRNSSTEKWNVLDTLLQNSDCQSPLLTEWVEQLRKLSVDTRKFLPKLPNHSHNNLPPRLIS